MKKFVTVLKWIAYYTIVLMVYVPVCVGLGYGLAWLCEKVLHMLRLD